MNVVHDHTPTHPHHLNAGFNNYPHTLVAKNLDIQRRHTLMVTTDMLPEARANIPGLQGKPHPTPPHPTPRVRPFLLSQKPLLLSEYTYSTVFDAYSTRILHISQN